MGVFEGPLTVHGFTMRFCEGLIVKREFPMDFLRERIPPFAIRIGKFGIRVRFSVACLPTLGCPIGRPQHGITDREPRSSACKSGNDERGSRTHDIAMSNSCTEQVRLTSGRMPRDHCLLMKRPDTG